MRPGPGAAGERGSATTAAGFLVGLAVAATFPLVLAGRPFYHGDFQAAFQPLRHVTGEAWAHGLPLWTSILGNGTPLLASPFAAILYPPNVVFALSPSHTAQVLSVLVLLHLLFGAWGAARLAKTLGATPAGAAAAALVFALSGATVSGTYMVVLVCTAMWIPWLLLAVLRVRDGFRFSGLALGAALGTMLLSGDPMMILAGVLGGVCLTLGPTMPLRAAGRFAAGLALAGLLAAPALLAFRQYFPATVRARGLPPDLRVSRSLHPLETIGAVVPGAFGSRVLGAPEGILYPGQSDGNGLPLFPGLYAGACAFAFAVVGAVRAPFRRRLLIWLAVLVLLALGRYGPFALTSGLPGLSALRYPSKWLLAGALPFALLVGGGISALEGKDEARSRRLLTGALAGALLALAAVAGAADLGLARVLAAACAPAGAPAPAPLAVEAIRSHLLSGAARAALPAAFALGVVRFTPAFGPVAWLLSLVLALDLATANRSLAPTAPASFYRARPAAIRAIESDPAGHARTWVDQSLAARSVPTRMRPGEELDSALARRRERLDAYAVASYGLPLAFQLDLEALGSSRYAFLSGVVYAAPRRAQLTLLGAAGVSHLVTPMELVDERLDTVARLDVGADKPLNVYRNRAVLPRARVVKGLVPASSDQMAALLSQVDDGFFTAQTIVEEADMARIADAWRSASPGAPAGHALVVTDTGARVVVRSSGGGGFLVLSDTYVPGWRAAVDGRDVPLFPADVAFRMVVVPPGAHDVVFDYGPWRR